MVENVLRMLKAFGSDSRSKNNALFINWILYFLCVHLDVCGQKRDRVCVWSSEIRFGECVISFHYVGPEDQIKIMRLSNKHLLSTELSH